MSEKPVELRDLGIDLDDLGFVPPKREIKNKKPVHIAMAVMRAGGATNADIAKTVDMDPSWVGVVCRQRWFVELVLKIRANAGLREFQKRMQGLAEIGASVLEDVMEADSSTNADKLRAADIAIKQGHGLPLARIETKTTKVPDALAELGNLDRELAELEGSVGDLSKGLSGGTTREDHLVSDGEAYSLEDAEAAS